MDLLNFYSNCEDVKKVLQRSNPTLFDKSETSTILITGANTGVGRELTLNLLSYGFSIIVALEEEKDGNELENFLILKSHGNKQNMQNLSKINICLDSYSSLQLFVKTVENQCKDSLQHLIFLHEISPTRPQTVENDINKSFFVNYLSVFYITRYFLPLLRKRNTSRVLVLSSEGHRGPYLTRKLLDRNELFENVIKPKYWSPSILTPLKKINNIKLFLLLFAQRLQEKESRNGVVSVAVDLGNSVGDSVLKDTPWLEYIIGPILSYFTKSYDQAAATVLTGLFDTEDRVAGEYLVDCQKHDVCKLAAGAFGIKARSLLWDISEELCVNIEKPDLELSGNVDC
eukprot:snap_masked-scaffold_18-processed-gene-5.23-mRNA-1 protein AED:0.25 eAED:0.25 QI:0/-1/0/1/-1/1/1/0/342